MSQLLGFQQLYLTFITNVLHSDITLFNVFKRTCWSIWLFGWSMSMVFNNSIKAWYGGEIIVSVWRSQRYSEICYRFCIHSMNHISYVLRACKIMQMKSPDSENRSIFKVTMLLPTLDKFGDSSLIKKLSTRRYATTQLSLCGIASYNANLYIISSHPPLLLLWCFWA